MKKLFRLTREGVTELEAELADNAWLTCPYDADILFNTSSELRLEAAARHLGINLSLLTSQAGHA